MSLIFDALQRSEAEHSGVDRSVLSAATEVLQRAELRARSERNALDQFEQPGPEQRVDRDISFPPAWDAASRDCSRRCRANGDSGQ